MTDLNTCVCEQPVIKCDNRGCRCTICGLPETLHSPRSTALAATKLDLITALEQAAQPVPGDVAGLIARLSEHSQFCESRFGGKCSCPFFPEAADTIERQQEQINTLRNAANGFVDRIAELEALLEKLAKQTDVSDKAYREKLNRIHAVRMLSVANEMIKAAIRERGKG